MMRSLLPCILATACLMATTEARADDSHPEPESNQHHANDGHRALRAISLGMVVTGGLVAAAGIAYAAVDEDDSPRSGLYIYDTERRGLMTTAAGAVVAATGVYLYFRSRRASAAPVAMPASGGAVVGFVARF